MMTMSLDMTAQLAAIQYGLAIALAVSFAGVMACASRAELMEATRWMVDAYQRIRGTVARRTVRGVTALRLVEHT